MFQPNSVIAGRYQVVRLVGQGGMSNLYLAYDRKYANATVVVKEMTASYSDPAEQQMAVDLFHREAKLLASLNHRHIPKVFDYFQFAGKYYLSMEYIDGVDLAVKLDEQNGPLPEMQVLEWGEQIATVLFYLHKHEPPIVFRDVKPSNIMISSQGVKLIDFGIARHFDQAKKGDTMRIGSPGYAPPEQYAAQTDPRSDIYALGVTLHHALTGRDPTATSTPFLVPPARDLNPNLSEATAAMLARATQLDPSDRYQSALDMKKDIKHILKRDGQNTRVVGAPPALPSEASQGQGGTGTAAPASQGTAPAQGTPATAAPAAAGAQAASGGTQQAATGAQPSTGGLAQGQTAQPGQAQGPGSHPLQSSASGSLAGAAQNPPKKKKKKKKKFSLSKLLLAACLFVVAAGVTMVALMDSADRDRLLSGAKSYVQSLLGELDFKQNPEDRLRESLLAGKPEALLPLLQSSEFKELSEEKQELFRLNMLAAGSSQKGLHMLHLLVPETNEDENLWKVATSALAAVNGSGGLDDELVTIVPQTYKPGELGAVLERSKKGAETAAEQSYLVLGWEGETLPERLPSEILFLSSSQVEGAPALSPLHEIDYQELFNLTLDSSSPPTVWGVPGPLPAQAVESDTALTKLPDASALAAMLNQAGEMGGRLILRAEDAGALSDVEVQGEVLLLATTPNQLPELASQLSGAAVVLSSPFDQSGPDAVQLRPRSQENLGLKQARLFDALLLAALEEGKSYDGLTVVRNAGGDLGNKPPTTYRWVQGAWLPQHGERG